MPPLPLPFFYLYLEALGVGCTAGRTVARGDEMNIESRIVEPVGGWDAWHAGEEWGDDTAFVQDWFQAGDELQNLDTLVHDVKIDEPDRWERALHWVRSLLVAT